MVADTSRLEILAERESPAMRASLDYHHALDLCAGLAHHASQPVHILASSTFYGHELVWRLAGPG